VVESSFVIDSLWSNEQVWAQSAQMLSKLNQIEQFHPRCRFIEVLKINVQITTVSISAQPIWHIACLFQEKIRPNCNWSVIEAWKYPFRDWIRAAPPHLYFLVFVWIDEMAEDVVIKQPMKAVVKDSKDDSCRPTLKDQVRNRSFSSVFESFIGLKLIEIFWEEGRNDSYCYDEYLPLFLYRLSD
jgi:hypothetical protein